MSDEETSLAVTTLISLVGERVHAVRKQKKLSRRELSELSGVSPRYLAQLEGGEGNISIGLLKRICLAFDCSIESFLVDDDDISLEASEIATRYRNANPETRLRVQQVLDPVKQRVRKAQRVCLVGLRGAGKSALGTEIGSRLDVPFVELNDHIERSAGMPISEVIALYGQEGYRELERASLDKIITSHERLLIAVAGGVVSDDETFSTLLARFNTVWVKAAPDEHMERVRAQGDNRPMADNPQAMAQLRQILTNREAKYRQADYQLDTTGKSLQESLEELSQLISTNALLKP